MVTLWLAVDDSDEDNGCLRIIPGTVRTHACAHVHPGRLQYLHRFKFCRTCARMRQHHDHWHPKIASGEQVPNATAAGAASWLAAVGLIGQQL